MATVFIRFAIRVAWLTLCLLSPVSSADAGDSPPILLWKTDPEGAATATAANLLPSDIIILGTITLEDTATYPKITGSSVSLYLSENEMLTGLVTGFTRQTNIDQSWIIQLDSGADDMLTLTVGGGKVIGSIRVGRRQLGIIAVAEENSLGTHTGVLYEIPAKWMITDQQDSKTDPGIWPAKKIIQRLTSDEITASSMEVSQSSSKSAYLFDEVISTTYTFRNIAEETHTGIIAHISITNLFYHDPDDIPASDPNTIDSYSPECDEYFQNLEGIFLICNLGDIAPGQTKRIDVTYSASSKDFPENPNILYGQYSQVSIGEDNDPLSTRFLQVSLDIFTDTDTNGISDFNESILGADKVDFYTGNDVVIDVLVLYMADLDNFSALSPKPFIYQFFNRANSIFANSDLNITFRPVGLEYIDYPRKFGIDTAMDDLLKGTNGLEDAEKLRARYGADLVTFLGGRLDDDTYCGKGSIPSSITGGFLLPFANLAYHSAMYTAFECGNTLAHELGHNFGLNHSRRQNPDGGIFPFAVGHGVDGQFITIMPYQSAFNTNQVLERFSNPDIYCLGDLKCGVDPLVNANEGADAVSVLDALKFQVASYRDPRPAYDMNSLTKAPVTAYVEAGVIAYRSQAGVTFAVQEYGYDRHFNDTYDSVDLLDIAVSYFPDELHVGKRGECYLVLFVPGVGLLQYTEEGVFEAWNGALNTLNGYTGSIILESGMHFVIADEKPLPELLGLNEEALAVIPEKTKIAMFYGYSLRDKSTLVYTRKPVKFTWIK